MIKKRSLIFIVFVCIFLSAFHSQQETEWKGKIEIVNGVEVVRNPIEPIYDEHVFGLNEELSIGVAEGSEDYMFSLFVSVDIDEKGNIYVLDFNEARL